MKKRIVLGQETKGTTCMGKCLESLESCPVGPHPNEGGRSKSKTKKRRMFMIIGLQLKSRVSMMMGG